MTAAAPHVPVLIEPILHTCAPISGHWVDGTFGAGGYTRRLLAAGAARVTGFDRDQSALDLATPWAPEYGDRLTLVRDVFSGMADHVGDVDGVVLDLGVSSMQLDQAERGFSFQKDGPLDMRMGQNAVSAEEVVNTAEEATLADILHHYGEERAARRIARAIVRTRAEAPITTTLQLAQIVSSCLPHPKPGQSHPATRSFQAIRIAVNDEFGELLAGLLAAERVLKPGGWLAVVTFHSMEDRVVKRFLTARSDAGGGGSRYAPERAARTPQFTLPSKRAIAPDAGELAANPRARSARLRVARRTEAAPGPLDTAGLGLPKITDTRGA